MTNDYAGILAVPAFLAFLGSLLGFAVLFGWLLRGIVDGLRRHGEDLENPYDRAVRRYWDGQYTRDRPDPSEETAA